ncbi:FecR family protein [Mucilaginibacter sp. SG564]|uniref:FecR family protein n=1 Tax=Mucilaginibacter sp. SG564 TaxID=2587022 RepID=UPI001556BBD3|nr:FecR family protein [Mucilaginibacter sp. SG564]NOW94217.1 ferric-dicitrate binding protein FerR (iron transport regulator) [Mucilaginibacter sp. SG564]
MNLFQVTNYTNYEVEDFLHDDFFIDWVLKNQPHHQAFWEQWLAENPGRKKTVDQARAIILAIRVNPLTEELTNAEVNAMATNIYQQAIEQYEPAVIKQRFYQTGWFRVAATVILVAGAGFLFFKKYRQPVSSQADPFLQVINHTPKSKLVRMSDGSLAVLKPGSGLKYLRSFHDKREVFLDGEAFFEIHKNPQMPFRVHSHDMVVQVLGTSFTVTSRRNNQNFKVVVNTGKVLVYNQKEVTKEGKRQHEVILTPNQQVTVADKQLSFKKETLAIPLTLSKEMAQKEFTFDNAPLSAVIDRINKDYDVNIEYDKAKLGSISLTISISDRPLDEKVKLICKAINATCQFIDGRIIINGQNPNPIPTN